MEYIRRIVDKKLDALVKAFGAIGIVGPKGCGKSRTAMEIERASSRERV